MSPLTACAFCGRDNEPASRFCIDCGKPMSASAARSISPFITGATGTSPISSPISSPGGSPIAAALAGTAPSPPAKSPGMGSTGSHARVPQDPAGACRRCGKVVEPGLAFCGHCGTPTATEATRPCESCAAPYRIGVDLFCAKCGEPVGVRVSGERDSPFGAVVVDLKARNHGPRVSVLDDEGEPAANFMLERGGAVVGRGDADIRFTDDVFLSPLHARFELRDGALWIRDLGSRNGSWCFIDEPTALSDGDVMLIGSQLVRFRRLGYPGPHPPEADATRRMGSLVPSADVAVLEQLRADGSVRDSFHLSPARTVQLGRESGDWIFPYDPTMSGRHAEIRSQDTGFYVHDSGSRNGVALAVRGERALRKGQRVLVGDQILRVESV